MAEGQSLAGRVALVTGAASGMGRVMARALAAASAGVAGMDVDAVGLDKLAAEPVFAGKLLKIAADVSQTAAAKGAVQKAVDSFGALDILINCAGITWPGYVDKIPDSVWDSMIQVDYMGTVNMVRAFLPYFMEQKHGSIANVSSVLGYMGVFGYAAYGPAKYAVVGFSECLRQDLLPYNITVSVIYPPDTDTPQLQEENKIKPPETKALSGNIKVMKPETIAFAFLKGIAGNKFTIVPGAMNKFTCFMSRHFPSIVWRIVSGDLRKFWEKHPLR